MLKRTIILLSSAVNADIKEKFLLPEDKYSISDYFNMIVLFI